MTGPEMFHDFTGRPRLRRGLRVDHLGDERLVLDPAGGIVHTVRGAAVRALDAILIGRHASETEAVAALVGAGIVDLPGLSRRDALLWGGSAAALIGSLALPSAVAAASGEVVSVSGSEGVLNTFTLSDGSLLYSLTHADMNSPGSVTRTLVVGSSPRNVELLLVGGGGSGGSGVRFSEIYGGGGGGGEVRYVNLGEVSSGTDFELVVAGLAFESSGNDTTVTDLSASPAVSYVADGGGIGGGSTAAESGGSGGGGSSTQTVAGASTTPSSTDDDQYGSAGAAGGSSLSGGGGGAGTTSAITGVGSVGGSGGSAVALADFFTLTGASVTGQLDLGAGGGGGGSGTDDAARGPAGSGAGLGGYIASNGAPTGGANALAGSGGGGGGGVSRGANIASGGVGGTGAIWVRVSEPE